MENELLYTLALSLIPNLKKTEARQILEEVDTIEDLFNESYLKSNANFHPKICTQLLENNLLEKARTELAQAKASGLTLYSIQNESYPYRLKECLDAPLILYSKGVCDLNASRIISIVGTRHATPYGRDLTKTLVKQLAEYDPNILIVSGLAYGIDVIAHQSAMEYGLKTVAIMAHGLQAVYPSSHLKHAHEIVQKEGAILSELPWGIAPEPYRFLQRNRIIAGLCDVCVVIESGLTGGSMKTARDARDYNREVLTFPGRINDTFSLGCNTLVVNLVAEMIQSAKDLFQKMNWDLPTKSNKQGSLFAELNEKQKKLLKLLSQTDEQRIHELMNQLEWSIQETQLILTELEIEGLIEKRPGGTYRKFIN